MMRKLILAFVATLLLGCMGFFTTGLGLAVLAPFHAGSAFFAIQETAVQGLLLIVPEPVDRVDILVTQTQLRMVDFQDCTGDRCAQQALNSLDRSTNRICMEISRLDEKTAQPFRGQLVDLFENLQQVLGQSTANQTQAAALTSHLSTALAVLKDPARSVSSLLEISAHGTQSQRIFVPTLSVHGNSQPRQVSARIIEFPSNSVGAMHAFFPLTGKHHGLECRACHPEGFYAGTPTECKACHAGETPPDHYPISCDQCHQTEGWIPASFSHQAFDTSDCSACHLRNRPANHFSGQCSACHSTTAWKPATFDHNAAMASDCASCHAEKRPANHYSGQCSACHSTSAWKPATFNHQAAGATDCVGCHADKRPANHWSGQCSACHSSNAWKPATFNHQAAGATDCSGCHSANRPANHYGGQCSACHSTTAWRPATFNHQAAGATNCAGCHVGNRPANHYAGQCSDCHNTNTWKGASFNHSFPLNHGNANGQCSACHPGGGSSWTCFGCHNQAKMDSKHNEKGIANYASRCLECHAGGRGGDD